MKPELDVQKIYNHFLKLTKAEFDEKEQDYKMFFMAGIAMLLVTMEENGYELDEVLDMVKTDASVLVAMINDKDEEL